MDKNLEIPKKIRMILKIWRQLQNSGVSRLNRETWQHWATHQLKLSWRCFGEFI